MIQKGNENLVHHMVLFECQVPDDMQSSDVFEGLLGTENGGNCHQREDMPVEFYYCIPRFTTSWVRTSFNVAQVWTLLCTCDMLFSLQ